MTLLLVIYANVIILGIGIEIKRFASTAEKMKTKDAVALILSLIIGYLAYLVMRPFLIPVLWGAVFVILFYPYYLWLLKSVRWKFIASVLACLTVAVFLIAPMAYAGSVMAGEMISLFHWLDEYMKAAQAKSYGSPLDLVPQLERLLGRYIDVGAADAGSILRGAIKDSFGYLSSGLGVAFRNAAEFFFNLVISLLTMFFLFIDGGRVLQTVRDILPISEEEKEAAFKRTRTVLSATLYGGVLVGALQGVILGLVFYLFGISGAALLGFAVFLASFLPGVGTALVWAPAAIYLFIIGKAVNAVMLAASGVIVMALVDQLLRQAVVSTKTRLHPLLLFFSVLGAVNVFGLIGIIAGPVILCAAGAVIEMYRGTVRGARNG